MRPGTLIDYRIHVRGIPVKWRTRINEWEPMRRFVDEQIRGPYRRWIHEHSFEETPGGTLVRDRIRYAVLGGALVRRLFVEPDIARIFRYRADQLSRIFAAPGDNN